MNCVFYMREHLLHKKAQGRGVTYDVMDKLIKILFNLFYYIAISNVINGKMW